MLKNVVVATLLAGILGAGSMATRDLSGQFQNGNFIFIEKNSAGTQYPKQIVESLLIK